VEVRRLTPGDVDAVLRLCGLAGWNQTRPDIRRLLALEPDGCFAACDGGAVVGTVTTTVYGPELAWVGMVLVDPQFRRRGIATALTAAALDHLRRCGVATVKLDATPAGRPVYERLGFEPESLLERWAGEPQDADAGTVSEGSWDDVAAADRAAFGADRGPLLRAAIADAGPPLVARDRRGEVAGYALTRPGSRAGYVGPLIADDPAAARDLLAAALVRLGGGPVFLDINTEYPGAADLVRRHGFARQRELLRMRLRPPARAGQSRRVFAIAGPEVG
jgi:predicted N-acetyltransferase YhbS